MNVSFLTINNSGKKLRAIVEAKTAKLLFDAQTNVKIGCPVDTGFAQNSIVVDLGRRAVVSDCEYLEALNNGHSAQAPAGFIQAGATRAARQINNP